MSRIDSGTILIAFFAILFGLTGAWFLRKSMRPNAVVEHQAQAPRRAPARVTVPLASRQLEPGTIITLDDVALFKMTSEDMKKHGVKSVFMSNPDQIIGKTLAVEIKRGETFDTRFFYPDGVGPGIVESIQPGQRAVTIKVDSTNALLGFAGAGQKVHVMFRFFSESPFANQDDTRERTDSYDIIERRYQGRGSSNRNTDWAAANPAIHGATLTLVQGATVLALGKRVTQTSLASQVGSDETVPVTLSVDPGDAEKLRLAAGHGELSLTLRHPDDEERVESTPRTIKEVLGIKDPPKVKVAAVRPRARREQRSLDIYRGQKRSRVEFSRPADNGSGRFQSWSKQTFEVPVWTDEDQKKLNAFYRDQQRRVEEFQQGDVSQPEPRQDFREQRSLFNPVSTKETDQHRAVLPSHQTQPDVVLPSAQTILPDTEDQAYDPDFFELSNASPPNPNPNSKQAHQTPARVAKYLEIHDPGRTE